MIILHRQNGKDNDIDKLDYDGIELDVRNSEHGLLVNHNMFFAGQDLNVLVKLTDKVKSYDGAKIFNIKESGCEDVIIDSNIKGYFLDSQLPDIIRISKEKPEEKHRFILRTSKYETLNFDLLNLVKPDYVWVDYHEWDNFSLYDYDELITDTEYIISESISPAEMIIVSPELYDLKYKNIISKMKQMLNTLDIKYSVCTKFPEEWK